MDSTRLQAALPGADPRQELIRYDDIRQATLTDEIGLGEPLTDSRRHRPEPSATAARPVAEPADGQAEAL